ncbi:MAG: glycosyltransferase family 9 protein [Bacteroidetes bacterium]|nr:glycosyltransferase family 9 protein [Bacteroidota bacterium]
MTEVKNILIIQTAFIGDAILASSLLEKFHAYYPGAAISMLVRKGNESIYTGHPFLKEVLVWDKQKNKLKNLFGILGRIRKNKYDHIINCHRYASSGFLTGLSGAKHTSGYKENPFSFLFNYSIKHTIGNGLHETERYNQLIEDFTDTKVFKPKLYPSSADIEHVKQYHTTAYVCMAPASVWFTKQLPLEKWMELCDITDQNTTIYMLGAPADKALCEKIKSASKNKNIKILAGELSLLQSAALMKAAKMNYVNDSAPLHLASAVNAPVTAFFTSTVPAFGFGPLSDNSKTLGVDDLACRPCGIHGYKACPLGHFKCGHLMDLKTIGNE